MKTVLFVNHRIKACGVQQFGRRVYDVVKNSDAVRYEYVELERPAEFLTAIEGYKPDYIVYNWHRGTMPWLDEGLVSRFKEIKHYFIYHEEFTRAYYDKYLFFGDYDFSGGAKFGEKKVLLPRPLLPYNGGYPVNTIPTIGSFGFGFWQKGFHTLTKLVNDTFTDAVLNLHMAYSHFGDPLKEQSVQVERACRTAATNPGLRLNITHDFKDDKGVLSFLATNDINVFLYDENGEGISSVIDYAISVDRPIGISKSKMFRHIYDDSILVGNKTIQDIIKDGTGYTDSIRSKWNIAEFRTKFDKEFI